MRIGNDGIIDLWTSYIVLIVLVLLLFLALFFAFFPENILVIWRRRLWFYLCIGLMALIGILVVTAYGVQRCDRRRWREDELQRIHRVIKDVNVAEFADKRKRTFETKKNWTFYTDSENDDDVNNINNLHYVTLNAQTLSAKERTEDVIKMKIQIWIENKERPLCEVVEESDLDPDGALTQTLIN